MNKIPFANTNFYEFFIDTDLVDRALSDILNSELLINHTYETTENSNVTASQSVYTKDNKPIYHKELFDELQKCVDEVSNIHFKNTKLAICDSWMTKSNFGESSKPHIHSFSIFSGLLYLTDSEKTITLFSIEDPFHKKLKHLFGPIINQQKYEYQSVPKKGRLIIWESDIQHILKPSRETHTRYTLAFNTWPSGYLHTLLTQRLVSDVVDVSHKSYNW